MKNIFLTAVMMIIVCCTAMAGNATTTNKAYNLESKQVDYSFVMSSNSLTRYLGLSEIQEEQMKYVFERMNSNLCRAKNAKGEEKRLVIIQKAVEFNLKAAHSVLTSEQFRKYLTTLNLTLYNKGLQQYCYSDHRVSSD